MNTSRLSPRRRHRRSPCTLFIPAVTFLFFCGCDAGVDSADGPTSARSIYPTAVGNLWAGSVTRYDTAGTVTMVAEDTIWIPRDTLLEGRRYFVFIQRSYLPGIEGVTQVSFNLYQGRNTAIGFVKWSSEGEVLLYSYPATRGKGYVSAVDTMISVPAGTFHCVGYTAEVPPSAENQSGFRSLAFLALGAGMVKSELYMSSDYSPILYRRAVWSLKRYVVY